MRICPACETRTEAETCPKDGRPTVAEEKLRAATQDPLVGRTIEGKYQIVQRLGRGGMGAVYRVRHVMTGGDAAVKLLRADAFAEEDAIRRFHLEAQNTHRLKHPNTVRVSDFGQTEDGLLFLVMEFVEGRNLADALKAEGRLAPSRAVHIAEQVLKSLGEAHAQRIVHRDVKPLNIMLVDQFGERDYVKVLDFGISRDLESSGLHTQGAIGSPKYMSPEQIGLAAVDGRADLYAVGLILYEMLAGRPAFVVSGTASEQVSALVRSHLHAAPPHLLEIAPGVCPVPLADLVMRLLEKRPDDRPRDATEVIEALAKIRRTFPLAEEPLPTGKAPAPVPAAASDLVDPGAFPSPFAATTLPDGAAPAAPAPRSVPTLDLETARSVGNTLPIPAPQGGQPPPVASSFDRPGWGHGAGPHRSTLPVVAAVAVSVGVLAVAVFLGFSLWTTDETLGMPAQEEASKPLQPVDPVEIAAPPAGPAAAAIPKTLPEGSSGSPTPAPSAVSVPGRHRITSEPAGAMIVDEKGNALGTSPVQVDPGVPAVRVVLDRHRTRTVTLEAVTAGEIRETTVHLDLLPEIEVSSSPSGAEVRLVTRQREQILGTTPSVWQVGNDVLDEVEAGQRVELVFSRQGARASVVVSKEVFEGASPKIAASLPVRPAGPAPAPVPSPKPPGGARPKWSF